MKRYPEYQETGVELISEIPKAWDLTKLKHVAQVDNSGVWGEDQGMLEIDAPVSTTAHLTIDGDWLIEQMPIRSFSKADYEYYSVKNGDIVIVKSSGSATNIITGKAGFIDYLCKSIVFSNFLMRVQPNRDRYEPKFLYYFLISSITKERIKRMVSTTTYPNLKVEEYISNLIPMPSSKDEQIKIAAFLDHKTKHLDELIRIKERKIELLREQRTALINQAVTKGLDPNVEMKPSGVDWIGEIPAHWRAKRQKYISKIVASYVDKHIDPDEIQVDVCNYTDVYYCEKIDSSIDLMKGSCNQVEYERSLLKKGDVVITKDSESPDDIGVPAFIQEELTNVVCGYHLSIIRAENEVYGEFLFRFIQSNQTCQYFESNSTGITRFSLGKSAIENLSILLPPLSEQTQIASFLDGKTQRIDELVSEQQRSIELLKEYRQSLISDAVTGKIDVRNEV